MCLDRIAFKTQRKKYILWNVKKLDIFKVALDTASKTGFCNYPQDEKLKNIKVVFPEAI